jgi:hypothetical protein
MSTKRWCRFRRWWRTNRRYLLAGAGSIMDLNGQATYQRMVRLFEEEARRP